jgi:hypothetical protein
VTFLLAGYGIAILDQGPAGIITCLGVGPTKATNKSKETGNTCLGMSLKSGIWTPKTPIYFSMRYETWND